DRIAGSKDTASVGNDRNRIDILEAHAGGLQARLESCRRETAGVHVADADHTGKRLLAGGCDELAIYGDGGRRVANAAGYSDDVHSLTGAPVRPYSTDARPGNRQSPGSPGSLGGTPSPHRPASRRSAPRAC